VRKCTHKKLAARLHKVAHQSTSTVIQERDFLKRMLKDTAVNLNACKTKSTEDRHIWWMNYKNLSLWFENWEKDLVELGFTYCNPIMGQVSIPKEQLRNILNFDETCLSLDGSTTNRGG
jgi:hypothetical protein